MKEDEVWVLDRLLPGQRAGTKEWSLFLKEVVEKEGYETFQLSPNLYVKKSEKGDVEGAILVHVDDIQLAATPTEGQTEGQIGREVFTDNSRTLRTWWNGGVSALLQEKI